MVLSTFEVLLLVLLMLVKAPEETMNLRVRLVRRLAPIVPLVPTSLILVTI